MKYQLNPLMVMLESKVSNRLLNQLIKSYGSIDKVPGEKLRQVISTNPRLLGKSRHPVNIELTKRFLKYGDPVVRYY